MKAVNSAAKPIDEVSCKVPSQVGEWKGHLNFTVAPLDDFSLVLGMNFKQAAKLWLLIGDDPCLVKAYNATEASKRGGHPMLSAMQLEKRLKRNEPTFLATLSMKEDKDTQHVPACVSKILKGFGDVMPEELPQVFPPRRLVYHQIELLARPPMRRPCRMADPRLAKLRRQLDDLLRAGFIRPSKAPFGAPVLFLEEA